MAGLTRLWSMLIAFKPFRTGVKIAKADQESPAKRWSKHAIYKNSHLVDCRYIYQLSWHNFSLTLLTTNFYWCLSFLENLNERNDFVSWSYMTALRKSDQTRKRISKKFWMLADRSDDGVALLGCESLLLHVCHLWFTKHNPWTPFPVNFVFVFFFIYDNQKKNLLLITLVGRYC